MPCFFVFHSPSPNILMPVLSTSRCNPVVVAFAEISKARYFWRRLTVLKSGTSQSNPASLSRLCAIPVPVQAADTKRLYPVTPDAHPRWGKHDVIEAGQ